MPFTFGRANQLDRDAAKRLVTSLSKLLEPGDAPAATMASNLEFSCSVPVSGTRMLDRFLNNADRLKRGRRRNTTTTERVLFALVANRPPGPLLQARRPPHQAGLGPSTRIPLNSTNATA